MSVRTIWRSAARVFHFNEKFSPQPQLTNCVSTDLLELFPSPPPKKKEHTSRVLSNKRYTRPYYVASLPPNIIIILPLFSIHVIYVKSYTTIFGIRTILVSKIQPKCSREEQRATRVATLLRSRLKIQHLFWRTILASFSHIFVDRRYYL